METRSELTRELVRTVRTKEAPENYDEMIKAVVIDRPITDQESRIAPEADAIRITLYNWASGWRAVLQPDPNYTHVRQRFTTLVEVWRRETAFEPSVTRRAIHWSYQQIIGMGPAALPLILEELKAEEDDWFWALTAITGEDAARGAETLAEAAHRWLEWASQHQLVSHSVA